MKPLFKFICLLVVSAFFNSQSILAQVKPAAVDNGSWQIVSNTANKKNICIQFYSPEGKLIYEEKLVNVKLNIRRKRVVKKLDKALNQVMLAYNEAKRFNGDEKLVARALAGD